MTLDEFNLREKIRNVAAATGLGDPADIAAKIADELSDQQLRQTVAITLPNYVQLVVSAPPADVRATPAQTRPTPGPSKANRIRAWQEEHPGERMFSDDVYRILGGRPPRQRAE